MQRSGQRSGRSKGSLKILLAKEMGFCFGVKRALALVEKAATEHGHLHTLGAVVHNRQVMASLESRGVASVTSLSEVAEGAVAVPSHGAPPAVFAEAESRGLTLLDATCPMVKAAQQRARQWAEKGFLVVIFGDPDHTEVKGIAAWARDRAIIVSSEDDLAGLPSAAKIALLSQTTQSLASFRHLASCLIQQRLGASSQLLVHNTICNATADRQAAALDLARQVDVMIVVGSRDSANTGRLTALCTVHTPTHQVESADDLEPAWFAGVGLVGVTAGASTPDWIVQPVVERIRHFDH